MGNSHLKKICRKTWLIFVDMYLNIEIKARCLHPERIRKYLKDNNADFKGTDNQCDTYFIVPNGRLKLRQGNIENNLIYYEREDLPGPKSSNFSLVKIPDAEKLKTALSQALGIWKIVHKEREIYFIKNVKFHIDKVEGIGSFVEIEAGNLTMPEMKKEQLQEQCAFYLNAFEIKEEDLMTNSYSDMII